MRKRLKALTGRFLLEGSFRKQRHSLGGTRHVFKGGTEIPYLHFDRGSSQTLVYLHGFSDRKESFMLTAKYLSAGCNIILPDLPGFGETKHDPFLPYTLDNYRRWITELLRTLDVGRVWLSGNSLGGAVASQIAFWEPDLVQTCIPICPAFYFNPAGNPLYEEFKQGKNPFLVHNEQEYDVFLARIFHRVRKPPLFISHALQHETIENRHWYQHMTESIGRAIPYDLEEPSLTDFFLNQNLHDTSVPVCFVWGAHDSFFPVETVEHLQQLNPRITSDVIEDCGHCPHLERPRTLAKILDRILLENSI